MRWKTGLESFCLALVIYLNAYSLPALAQSGTPKESDYPSAFKVFSRGAREQIKGFCHAEGPTRTPKAITCEFLNVRFQPYGASTQPDDVGAMLEELEAITNKDQREYRDGIKLLSDYSRARCSTFQSELAKPELGPRRRAFLSSMVAACSQQDPLAVARQIAEHDKRTCSLWVASFTLPFKKAGRGRWVFRQEEPSLLSDELKLYELVGAGYKWELIETRIPKRGTEPTARQPAKTIWSWKYDEEYELPCDFIRPY
jgi:hypothetical protein